MIDHVGFPLTGYEAFRRRLEALGVSHSRMDLPEFGALQRMRTSNASPQGHLTLHAAMSGVRRQSDIVASSALGKMGRRVKFAPASHNDRFIPADIRIVSNSDEQPSPATYEGRADFAVVQRTPLLTPKRTPHLPQSPLPSIDIEKKVDIHLCASAAAFRLTSFGRSQHLPKDVSLPDQGVQP